MECTQRLECTQQEFFNHTERECPEQIGFLGICGNKYPVKKGPNKIGRDPQTCNIVLNLNSISRQHAVINVLNNTEFMLMDLDSANKTKLLGRTLLPYMPQPLKNGDMVQFGDVFGMFRLLEEHDDLPMTQALPMTQPINIPDTPIPTRHMSKLNLATTIPESPDVSDKDDSFIIASQPKGHQFKSANTHHFIKPGKTISILPVGGNKIDNIYWNSSKKSTSLNLDDSTSSLNDSMPFVKLSEKENEANAGNIHEMETQAFPPIADPIHEMDTQVFPINKIKETDIFEANTQPCSPIPDSIYTANTQLPGFSTSSPSIYTANTQLPASNDVSPSIHTANTELPRTFNSPSINSLNKQIPPGENLPKVRKINEQQDLQFDLCAENDNSIYNAETQMFPESPIRAKSKSGSPTTKKSNEISKLDRSDDVVLFDEIDSQPEDENFESQAIFTEDIFLPINKCLETESEPLSQIALPKSSKRNMRIKSDSSTDCEEIDDDILPTQKIPERERKANNGDSTDCEDEMIELKPDKKPNKTAEALDLEDVATQVIEVLETPPTENDNFDDMLTQVIDVVEVVNDSEDLRTQILVEDDVPTKLPVKTQLINDEVEISPFKIPLKSVFKAKKKDVSKTPKIKAFVNTSSKCAVLNDDDKYYQDTQDIYEDLCSQKASSHEISNLNKSLEVSSKDNKSDTSLSNSDVEENINNFVSSLSSQDVRDVIGAEKVAPLKRVSSLGSEASDLELTPKKNRLFKFMDIDLPNSQEIKTSVSLSSKSVVTESSSESETEQNSEDQCTPILFRKKKKTKHDAKMDLTKRFDVEALPTRVITRVRKPTSKVQDIEGKKLTESILKPKFLTEQDDDVDREIITENITRLKSKNEKSKNTKDSSKMTKLDEIKNIDATKTVTDTRKLDTLKNLDKSKIPDEEKDIQKEKRSHTNTENKKTEKSEHKSEEIHKEETVKKRESKRKKKSSSPVNDNKDVVDHIITEIPEKSNESSKTVENINISNEIGDKKTRESKRNTKTSASKIKDEKPRGPIMIEPHTITIPVKEVKPKREYKRKNKEPVKKENKHGFLNHDFTIEIKPETSKIENVDLTESKRPVRSTRGRKKISEDFIDPTEDSQGKTKRTKKSKEASPEIEVRRSKRQRTVKEKEEPVVQEPVVKSILKKSVTMHEQSTVYNLSSESNSDSPNLKRPANEFDAPAPMPKRTRSVANNASMRATPSRTQKTCYVLFTAFPYEEVKAKLEKLGAVVVTDVMQCTVLLTLQIRRTFKLLCAVGLGKPIVGPNWVQACADTNMIVDPWLYTIKDESAEKRFRFSLERTLTGRRQFLKGYNLSSTPNVMPQASEMKLIVQCSGGSWQEGGPRWLCLSCAADRALWPELRKRGATLVTTEFILGGVLQQRLDIEANRIKIQ